MSSILQGPLESRKIGEVRAWFYAEWSTPDLTAHVLPEAGVRHKVSTLMANEKVASRLNGLIPSVGGCPGGTRGGAAGAGCVEFMRSFDAQFYTSGPGSAVRSAVGRHWMRFTRPVSALLRSRNRNGAAATEQRDSQEDDRDNREYPANLR